MKFPKTIPVITILLFIIGIFISTYSISINSADSPKQIVPLFVLQTSETEISKVSFANSLAISLSKSDRNLYAIRKDTQNIGVVDETRKIEKNILSFPLATALTVNSYGRIFVAGDSKLNIIDTKGGRKEFPIPARTTSIAALDDNKVVVAAPNFDGLLTIFDDSGRVVSKIGNLKQLERSDAKENLFLNSGKVAATQSGEIFYVSMFSPNPVIQKFSKQGQLLKEFAIEGASLELQSNRAKDFLSKRNFSCVGGYYVVRSLAVDPVTNHLWIGINGLTEKGTVRAESGVLYEYTLEGEKIAEYALTIASTKGEINVITDIKNIVVKAPYVNILTSAGQIYQFNLEQRMAITPKVQEVRRQNLLASFIPAKWRPSFMSFEAKVSQENPCPAAISYTCEQQCPSGSSPVSGDCDAELSSRLNVGERIISGTCNTGTAVGANGGCSGSITGCTETNVRVTYSVTLECNAAPTPTLTPTPEPTPGVGGGGGCVGGGTPVSTGGSFCTTPGTYWDDC